MPTWLIVLTSAAVASLVSGVITLVGQTLERRSRRRELLFTKAIEMSAARVEFIKELALKTGGSAALQDPVMLAEKYFRWLTHLLDKGELPAEAHSIQAASEKKS
jgi:hypothetical protein